jgi:glycosyltransferase involved in cell wall biosynthesis
MGTRPTITAAIAAYQAEQWIGEALESILGQTRPPEEVVVVDDGSTDGTAGVLASFGDAIRVVRQENGGCPAAFNTAYAHATGDFVAMCGADDIWEPRKLEWQAEAMAAHPEVDLLFGHAEVFGTREAEHLRPTGEGVLDGARLAADLFVDNVINAPSIVVRRALFERLGPFWIDFGADDYEYWFRALRASAAFFYDPRTMVRWRMHGGNLSAKKLWMDECMHAVRMEYAADVADRAIVDEVLAREAFKLGRRLAEDPARTAQARAAFRVALAHRDGAVRGATARAAVWTGVLSLPEGVRRAAGTAGVAASRAVDTVSGGRKTALP